mgnify:CR=1 FL=1
MRSQRKDNQQTPSTGVMDVQRRQHVWVRRDGLECTSLLYLGPSKLAGLVAEVVEVAGWKRGAVGASRDCGVGKAGDLDGHMAVLLALF